MKIYGNNNQSKKKRINHAINKNEDYQILNQAIKYYEFLIKKDYKKVHFLQIMELS